MGDFPILLQIGIAIALIVIGYFISKDFLEDTRLFPIVSAFLIFLASVTDVINDDFAIVIFLAFPFLIYYLIIKPFEKHANI